jgi:hypothetical protein
MWVLDTKIEETFRKVKQIQEHMQRCCIAPDRAKLSVEDLHWAISDMYGIQIEKHEVAFEGEYVRGLVERYENRARILVRKNQEEDWLRFTNVKELCQIAISEKEDWSVDGTKTLDALLYEVRLDNHEEDEKSDERAKIVAPHPIQSEKLAEIAAIELMYPFRYRDADMTAIDGNKTTLRAIAVHFHAPEFVVGTALNPRHLSLATDFWAKVNK